MLKNAYLLAKIGADTAGNEQHSAEILAPRIGSSIEEATAEQKQLDRFFSIRRCFQNSSWESATALGVQVKHKAK